MGLNWFYRPRRSDTRRGIQVELGMGGACERMLAELQDQITHLSLQHGVYGCNMLDPLPQPECAIR